MCVCATQMAWGECMSVWDGQCCVCVCVYALWFMPWAWCDTAAAVCGSIRERERETEREVKMEKINKWKSEVEAEWKVAERQIRSRLCKKRTRQTAASNARIYHHNRLAGPPRRRLDYLRRIQTHCLCPAGFTFSTSTFQRLRRLCCVELLESVNLLSFDQLTL